MTDFIALALAPLASTLAIIAACFWDDPRAGCVLYAGTAIAALDAAYIYYLLTAEIREPKE